MFMLILFQLCNVSRKKKNNHTSIENSLKTLSASVCVLFWFVVVGRQFHNEVS